MSQAEEDSQSDHATEDLGQGGHVTSISGIQASSLVKAKQRLTSPDEETAPAPPALLQHVFSPDAFETLVDSSPSPSLRPKEEPADSSLSSRPSTPKPILDSGFYQSPKLPHTRPEPDDPSIEETGPISVSTLFPVPNWRRYEAIAPIGEGGMGTVYKARDPRLNRIVAIKFIRGNDPRLVDRFFREARAQARIDHPNVCKVFEVGEVMGHPYITMEFVDGKPLDLMARGLGLEQKVRLIRDVALGLHAAHRIGLIHRDIKPANILVGRTSDGDLHPSVVDFGLARETADTENQTMFGIQGTPAYMSPEQAAGDMRALDRRTDVYSLGATLYELLTNKPPFLGKHLYEIIGRIAAEPPKPPRELDKRIPPDIETIVLRCLEKEPSNRYESAKAFADDLNRYLEGEPIQAKPISRWQQLRSKARKNKWMTALIGLSAVAFLALIGVSVRARIRANEQAELTQEVSAIAQRFGQDVKEMELFMRYAHVLPLHDITRERNVVRARMNSIEQRMNDTRAGMGGLAVGPGHFALGRGYISLQEPEKALTHFEEAEKSGYDRPDVFKELGKAHGALYQERMEYVRSIEEPEARAKARQELERLHLWPAREYLRKYAQRSGEADSYTAALLDFYEQKYDEALIQAESANKSAPWFYDASKLRGDILFAKASLSLERGMMEEALRIYGLSTESYEKASEIAKSDPAVHEAAAKAWIQVMRVGELRGMDISLPFQKSAEHCEHAIAADSQNRSALAAKAVAFTFYGRRQNQLGHDPRETLKIAIDAGQQSTQYGGPSIDAYSAMGTSYWIIAEYEMSISADATESLTRTIEFFEKAIALDSSSSWNWNDLAIAYGLLGDNLLADGKNPLPYYAQAIHRFEQSIIINPQNTSPYNNIGWFKSQIAQYELDHAGSVVDHLVDAFTVLDYAFIHDENHFQPWNNLGLSHTLMARYEAEIGENPAASLERALHSFTVASELNPDDIEAKQGKANVYLAQAQNALEHNENPSLYLQRAQDELGTLFKNQPDNTTTLLSLAEHQRLSGVFAAKNKRPFSKYFESAERYLKTPLTKGASNIHLLRALASLYETWTQTNAEHKKPLEYPMGEGLSQIAAARIKNPNLPALDVMEGALYLAQAQVETKDRQARQKSAELAHRALRKGLMGNFFLRRAYEPLLIKALALKEVSSP